MKELLTRDMQMLIDGGVMTVEQCIELMHKFGGVSIHIPTISGEVLRRLILLEYNGGNVKELAVKYRRSERTIYAILASKSKPKQLEIFDDEGKVTRV